MSFPKLPASPTEASEPIGFGFPHTIGHSDRVANSLKFPPLIKESELIHISFGEHRAAAETLTGWFASFLTLNSIPLNKGAIDATAQLSDLRDGFVLFLANKFPLFDMKTMEDKLKLHERDMKTMEFLKNQVEDLRQKNGQLRANDKLKNGLLQTVWEQAESSEDLADAIHGWVVKQRRKLKKKIKKEKSPAKVLRMMGERTALKTMYEEIRPLTDSVSLTGYSVRCVREKLGLGEDLETSPRA